MHNPFTHHPRDTPSPQTYWEHAWFSISNSTRLIGAGLAGIAHGIFPPIFKFYTAQLVIRYYFMLAETGRHDDYIKLARIKEKWSH